MCASLGAKTALSIDHLVSRRLRGPLMPKDGPKHAAEETGKESSFRYKIPPPSPHPAASPPARSRLPLSSRIPPPPSSEPSPARYPRKPRRELECADGAPIRLSGGENRKMRERPCLLLKKVLRPSRLRWGILAEGAIALLVTLSGSALFAS